LHLSWASDSPPSPASSWALGSGSGSGSGGGVVDFFPLAVNLGAADALEPRGLGGA